MTRSRPSKLRGTRIVPGDTRLIAATQRYGVLEVGLKSMDITGIPKCGFGFDPFMNLADKILIKLTEAAVYPLELDPQKYRMAGNGSVSHQIPPSIFPSQ
jgi:hypothetical protein